MLALLMVFATCYGVLQLAVLGWGTRTVRLGTLALAIGAGMYGCAMITVLLQLAYTRTLSALTGDSLGDIVPIAGHTLHPVLEEVIKMAPLLVIGCRRRARAQWRLTDHLLVGAALGAGFGLMEALLYNAGRAGTALALPDGWVVPSGLRPPYIPGIEQSLVSWLPAPYSVSELTPAGPDTGFHIAWSALAGFGVGLLLRRRGPVRLLGLLPLVLVSAAHAAHNFDVPFGERDSAGAALVLPFVTVEPMLGVWPLLALGLAVWSDGRVLRRGKGANPGLLLAGEPPGGLSALAALGRYAMIRPPYTTMVAHRFMLLRRTACYAGGTWYADGAAEREMAYAVRARMEASPAFMSWRAAGLRSGLARRRSGGARRRHRHWKVLIWAALALPVLTYFLLGTTPGWGGAQQALAGEVVFPVLLALSGIGLALVAWQLVTAARALPAAWREPLTERATKTQLRLLTGAGTMVLGILSCAAWITGVRPGEHVISNAHVLNALNDLLMYGGLALLLAGFVFFPPAGVVAVAGGGLVVVPTVTAGFVALEALGLTGVLLAQATPESGGDGGDGGGSPSGEQARLRELGQDPATGTFRQSEMETAQRVEQQLGITLTRSKHVGADWVDRKGATYDAVGNFPGQYFDQQWPRLQQAIKEHLQKVDYVPVDVSKFAPEQVAKVREFIQKLGPRVFLVGE
ncbi:PrsW family intramembrane metalloprotease [Nonomuraea sp. K274]|uniref:PrsW family intramembrane metalloprotease n=1 Tax=Nonomuraea cypriaca TaxID=1187855 RepID=A0A931A3I3_9ACTN|nr:PrsW family glutamic-type intramembrane protease [Nonomuraea cypriaca]MBF8185536.1 PrsW family intramembrane metalloprotease [Nonomuraea cypriaca]